MLSGGNSANLPLLASGGMPKEINHFRIGEAITLGRNVLDRSPWPGTRQDTFRIVAEVVEVERKPSIPIGHRGQDAFGGHDRVRRPGRPQARHLQHRPPGRGRRRHHPGRPGIIVLGGSSDHLVLDVEEADEEVKVGDELGFFPSYGSLLAATTSPYVQKAVIRG